MLYSDGVGVAGQIPLCVWPIVGSHGAEISRVMAMIGEAALSVVIDKLATPLLSELGRLYHVKDELGRLQRTLIRLQAMLRDMERRQIADEHLVLWLQELNDAACDAEDLLEEFENEDLRRKVEGEAGGRGCFQMPMKTQVCSLSSCLSPGQLRLRQSMARRIDEIRRRLDDIAKDRNNIGVQEPGVRPGPEDRNKRPTFGLLKEVFGMERERDEIVNLLTSSTDTNIGASASSADGRPTRLSVLAIVGMGGVGKTTLAQYAYNDQRVKEYFDPRMWVSVSDDLNVGEISKQMLDYVDDSQMNLNPENLDVVHQRLIERLNEKRFLLVLDDVWDENFSEWSDLYALLTNGGKDCKVIITTRNTTKVPSIVRATKTVKLDGLGFEDCWSLFKSRAFEDGKSENHPTLEAIGREIVKKLGGVPLAVTTVGGFLCGDLEERHWREVQEHDLRGSEPGEHGIFPALSLSYEHLPPHLKQCFAYLSLYPKNIILNRDVLVQRWIAQGFVHCSRGRQRMEDVGSDYFDDLLSRSLIQFVDGKFVIHNLIYELAQRVSQPDYSYIPIHQLDRVRKDVRHLRHLGLSIPRKQPEPRDFENLYTFDRLRTIIFWFRYNNYNTKFRVPLELFIHITCLRVLDLSFGNVDTLPDSIGQLKHLRYLDLRKNPIKELPTSLCSIYRLQTLKLEGCNQLLGLPVGISNLTNLRHLEAEAHLISGVARIGRLTSLQKLVVFSLSDGNGIKLSDLKDLNELGGRICIQNLDRVRSTDEAAHAKLNKKRYLRTLEMEWGDVGDAAERKNEVDEQVLNGLVPPPYLKKLEIKGYGGVRYPVWIEHQSAVTQLESICLERCKRWSALPSLRRLSFLKVLNIAYCPLLKELPALPTTLVRLTLLDVGLTALQGLQELQLQVLEISDNSELREVSQFPITLKKLIIKNIPLLKYLPGFWKCQEDACSNGPSLSTLEIEGCSGLTSLREGLLQHRLQALRALKITDCGKLALWPQGEGFLATLHSLEEELTVERCPKLVALPEGFVLPPSLKKLAVVGCPLVPDRALFMQLHNLPLGGSYYIENRFQNLTSCCDEALQHFRELDLLEISYVEVEDRDVFLTYDRGWTYNRGDSANVSARRLGIEIRSNAMSIEGSLFRCLRSCHACAPLRWMLIRGFPRTEFTHSLGADEDPMAPLPYHLLASIDTLLIEDCRDIRRLPTDMLLRHLTSLRDLAIYDCPRMALSSLEEGIRFLPSLRYLTILRCPMLLVHDGADCPLATSTISSSSSDASLILPSPHPVMIKSLGVDDSKLFSDKNFVRNFLTSLQELVFGPSKLTSFAATEEEAEGLSSIARTVEILGFSNCSSLLHLPSELPSLFPSLKRLTIQECPEIRCMPQTGLPASLESLVIADCPALARRCRRPWNVDEDSEEEDATRSPDASSDWHVVARIPNIEIDGRIIQGTRYNNT